MDAWKIRALVYGMLAVVSALVLGQSGVLASAPATAHALTGKTAQGYPLVVRVRGARIEGFTIDWLGGRCRDGRPDWISWWPSTRQSNVSYRQSGLGFEIHERPDARFPFPRGTRTNTYMRGRISLDGRSVKGSVWFTMIGYDRTCRSGPIAFRATPQTLP